MSTVHSHKPMVFAVALFGTLVAASALERNLPPASSSDVPRPDIQEALLANLEEELSGEHRQETEGRLPQIKEAMRSTFEAMPKNENGKLAHDAVHYVLHRFFVRHHGWTAQGIMPPRGRKPIPSKTWKTAYPLGFLEDRVPPKTVDILENRLVGYGFGLRELAVVAVMLENLAHSEARARLQRAFHAHSLPFAGTIDIDGMDQVLDTYMASYVRGTDISQPIAGYTPTLFYYSWSFERKALRRASGSRSVFDPSSAAEVIDRVTDRYALWHKRECLALKHQLIAIDGLGSGSVPLKEFYSSDNLQFRDDLKYLRRIGALDESDPNSPRVIVSNYLNGPSNCVAAFGNFSLCCPDECDALFGHLEHTLQAPDAAPAAVAALVAALPSDTVDADRKLSSELILSLEHIADTHDGRVPLHGRAFAQWMHRAFPNECEIPGASFAQMRQPAPQIVLSHHGASASDTITTTFPPSVLGEAPWNMEQITLAAGSHQWAASGVAVIAAIGALAVTITRIWRSTLSAEATVSQNLLVC